MNTKDSRSRVGHPAQPLEKAGFRDPGSSTPEMSGFVDPGSSTPEMSGYVQGHASYANLLGSPAEDKKATPVIGLPRSSADESI
jgi:hypothetical protein